LTFLDAQIHFRMYCHRSLSSLFPLVCVSSSVQYNVIEDSVKDAWYKLTEPQSQIRAYVEDVIRGAVRTY